MMRGARLLVPLLVGVGLGLAGCAPVPAAPPERPFPDLSHTVPTGPPLLSSDFTGPDGVITSAEDGEAEPSPWRMTSGSLYRDNDVGWTGRINNSTGSAVFRMVSKADDFGDVDVHVRLRVDRIVTTDRTPEQSYDGAHVWVRYRSPTESYGVSVDRRDGAMAIKKKCTGGPSNDGSYYDLTPELRTAGLPRQEWQEIDITVVDLPDGAVAISARRDGEKIQAVDTGVGCAPLVGPGAVGLRGDNAELRFDDYTVTRRVGGGSG
jgi:hypothetical protein